jgi:hypothetical protein
MAAQLSYCLSSHGVSVRIEGRATMVESPALRRLAEDALAGGAAEVRFELTACTWMDSTFMGTLLCLMRSAGRGRGRLLLVAPRRSASACCSRCG